MERASVAANLLELRGSMPWANEMNSCRRCCNISLLARWHSHRFWSKTSKCRHLCLPEPPNLNDDGGQAFQLYLKLQLLRTLLFTDFVIEVKVFVVQMSVTNYTFFGNRKCPIRWFKVAFREKLSMNVWHIKIKKYIRYIGSFISPASIDKLYISFSVSIDGRTLSNCLTHSLVYPTWSHD